MIDECESSGNDKDEEHRNSYYIFLFAAALAGIGNAGLNILAMPYIDESVRKEDSPMYVGR